VSLARHAPPAALEMLAELPPAYGWFIGARSYDSRTRTVTSLG
jgi:hypothetical protein